MPDLGTATSAPIGRAEPEPDDRQVARRRSLPGGRAVVGALLITLAVIGVFAAWLSATEEPTTRWVVVSTTVAAGDELAVDDLDTVAIDLPDAQADRTFAEVDEVVGAITIAPLSAGDLVTRSVVRTPDAAPGRSLFSFELPTSRALAGQLDPGDRVDVVATADGRTGYVATGLEVVRGTIDGGAVTITLAVDDPARVLALGNAVDEAAVHLVASARAGDSATLPDPSETSMVADTPFAEDLGSTPADDAGPAAPDPTTSATASEPAAPTEPPPSASPTGGG